MGHMRMIAGLGNPGIDHQRNRHNAGFMVIDRLAAIVLAEPVWEMKFDSLIFKFGDVLMVKPQLFMNRSGEAIARVTNFYKVSLSGLWVIHDDLDIRLGEYKIQMGVGPKIHNGMNSVEKQLGKTDFWRVRLGIDNRPEGEARMPGDE